MTERVALKQEPVKYTGNGTAGREADVRPTGFFFQADKRQPEKEPVAWRNAAIRVGEDLCSVGPFGYYDMTAKQWLDWALSVVTVHAPPQRTWEKPWVSLTDEEILKCPWAIGSNDVLFNFARAIEAKLKEKNT